MQEFNNLNSLLGATCAEVRKQPSKQAYMQQKIQLEFNIRGQ